MLPHNNVIEEASGGLLLLRLRKLTGRAGSRHATANPAEAECLMLDHNVTCW